jgi:hypothetical protein
MFPLKIPKPIEWGNAYFTNDTVLYSDWSYIQTTSGGINSIGGGVPIVSLSVAWSQSHWSNFKKKVSGTLTEIEYVCSKREATITGFASFISSNSEEFSQEQMDGADWITTIMCEGRPDDFTALISIPWAVVYFRKDYFSIPLDTWHKIRQPINVLGEIIGIGVNLHFGQRPCFVKARAAAFIK